MHVEVRITLASPIQLSLAGVNSRKLRTVREKDI